MPKNENSVAKLLKNSPELNDTLLLEVVEKSLELATKDASHTLQKLLSQKEKLELEIRHQAQKLQEIRQNAFQEIETALRSQYENLDVSHLKKLTQLKLDSIDILDLLSEILESAFINALENGEKVEASFREITRSLTYKTLKNGYISLDRIRHVISTVVAVTSEMAEATPNLADEIIKGALYGAKKGLTEAIHEFKDRFAYIPEEANPIQIQNLQQSFEDLQQADKLFIQIVQDQARQSTIIINDKMRQNLEHMRPDLSELIVASKETLAVISENLSKIGKSAVKKGEKVLHSKAAIEAKRLGVHVWDVTKNAVGTAISSAKEAIDQKKSKK